MPKTSLQYALDYADELAVTAVLGRPSSVVVGDLPMAFAPTTATMGCGPAIGLSVAPRTVLTPRFGRR